MCSYSNACSGVAAAIAAVAATVGELEIPTPGHISLPAGMKYITGLWPLFTVVLHDEPKKHRATSKQTLTGPSFRLAAQGNFL
mmetsp:Transcript_104752/g.208128  ORF Transcript_104752/g.208128 Transcript_104752/m.208128 type:complete len:83 (+) Transcript_104752:14-262(+)